MNYTLWERLTGGALIPRGELTPRCDVCRARTRKRGEPRLFLLPIHQDKDYTPSAEYYASACRPLERVEDIPVGQRACRMWALECPQCGEQAVLVADFLRVRGQEVPEQTAVCDYAPLAGLLRGTRLKHGPPSPGIQSFEYQESVR